MANFYDLDKQTQRQKQAAALCAIEKAHGAAAAQIIKRTYYIAGMSDDMIIRAAAAFVWSR